MKIYDFNGKKNISGERIREARIKMHLSPSITESVGCTVKAGRSGIRKRLYQ